MTTALNQSREFNLSQTMLRIRDPQVSVAFYRDILGMTLLEKFDCPDMKFSLYFMNYLPEGVTIPEEKAARAEFTFNQKGSLELTHNWGTESDPQFKGYHNGNDEPRGFGHIGLTVPDVYAACTFFESKGIEFVKRPDDGKMKGIAFIKDPDGYWIEILQARSLAGLTAQFGKASQ
jgi:lactoylglutathione lyase